MIKAIIGSGGKTTLLKNLAQQYRAEGKTVFVTTTTHMFLEEDMLLTDDAETIIERLKETGYAMAGIPDGIKFNALSEETYAAVCNHADVVLVEADGSRQLPLKHPGAGEFTLQVFFFFFVIFLPLFSFLFPLSFFLFPHPTACRILVHGLAIRPEPLRQER